MNNLQIIDERNLFGKDFKVYGDFQNPLFLAIDVSEWIEYLKTENCLKLGDFLYREDTKGVQKVSK